jgi:hypothetical protein
MLRHPLLAAALAFVLLALIATPAGARTDMSGQLPRATEPVVLGGEAFGLPSGEGWGAERPSIIFNGGDPSGLISDVHWSSWGAPVARGSGRNSIFKPHGGYYRHQVAIQLRAEKIGSCEGRRAYLRLLVREPSRPGGPPGPWRSWSGASTICSSPH